MVIMMTKKRFIFNGGSNTIEYDGKSILLDSCGEKIEDLLNELHDENVELKKELDSYKPVIFESESTENGYITLYEKKDGD